MWSKMHEIAKVHKNVLLCPWDDPQDAIMSWWIKDEERWANWPYTTPPQYYMVILDIST